MNSPAQPSKRPARALIADDERLMREQLRARLAEVWPELEIVAEAKNGLEAVELTESLHPDLVFLDIRMPGMTGVEAARAIAQLPVDEDDDGDTRGWSGCEIVFITAYDQYAIEAFEQGVVDYVLKPAERERLLVTVERIRKRLAQRAGGANGADDVPPAALQQLLQRLAKTVVDEIGKLPVIYIKEGSARDELIELLANDPSISILVLAASTGPEGPGPLISFLASKGMAKLRVPVTIVPGSLTHEEIDAIS